MSDALQNMMLQHADMRTYIKHYLPRRVTVDTRAIVSGYEPQNDLMRAACRMLRWVDPDRPQELTPEQSQSVNQNPRIRRLVKQREALKRDSPNIATNQPLYKTVNREIISERQRLRAALLKDARKKWDLENPVREIEEQLAGLKFSQNVKTGLDLSDDLSSTQRRLVETILTLPGTTLEEEMRRRNAAINAVAAHCRFQEGGAAARERRPAKRACPPPIDDTRLAAADVETQALDAAILSVFKEERPKVCFMCLGEQCVKSFASPGDLTKHFKRKHLAHIKEGDRIACKVCRITLQHKQHLQNHAFSIHGTVS